MTDFGRRLYLKKNRQFIFLLIVGLFLTFFIKQGYLTYCGISPESMMEINIARHITEGKGPLLSIKESYLTSLPVIHPAAGERGILYPLLLSPFIKKSAGLQWINLTISFITALMFFFLVKSAFDDKIAWLSFITFLFIPQVALAASYLWNTTLILFFLVAAGLVFVKTNSIRGKFITGVLTGLAFWTDPWALFFILGLLPGLLLSEDRTKESLKTTGMVAAGLLLTALPLLIWTAVIYKNPFPPNISAYFQVKSYSEYLWESYNYTLPGIPAFITSNFSWILSAAGNNMKIQSSFFTVPQVLPAIIIAIAGFFLAGKNAYAAFPKKFLPLLSFSLLFFPASCLVWSHTDFIKIPIFSMIFILPAVYYFLSKFEIRTFPVGLLLAALVMIIFLNRFIAVHYHVYPAELQSYDIKVQMSYGDDQTDWMNTNTAKGEKIAAIHPWVMNLKTGRPCGLMPLNLTVEQLREFTEKFGYNYIAENERTDRGIPLRSLLDNAQVPWLKIILGGVWRVQQK